ncbi:hypothetical protein LTR67_007807 [Exophiala xenobiotica]
MADSLYDILKSHLQTTTTTTVSNASTSTPSPEISKYLSRLVSLRLSDLTTTEPQSLAQSAQSNLVSIQALSSRSHRTTTTSSDHLSTLRSSLPALSSSVDALRQAIPDLDASAVAFASSYSNRSSKDDGTTGGGNTLLNLRRESALLARQADKAQDILELPSLLSAAIASASASSNAANSNNATSSTSGAGGANYTQALDLFAHIKRLEILYPDSQLVKSVLVDAEVAMKDMTTNLIANLRSQNIRLAAAIRMIGWLRRVAPELGTVGTGETAGDATASSQSSRRTQQFKTTMQTGPQLSSLSSSTSTSTPFQQGEGHFGALFLCARLATFLSMTEALSPLRDLADQETQARKADSHSRTNRPRQNTPGPAAGSGPPHPEPTTHKPSSSGGGSYNALLAGQQTERYLKRYIEIFREQSFSTISMYRNIFPDDEQGDGQGSESKDQDIDSNNSSSLSLSLSLPPALQSFPLHLVDIFMATLKQYLPNVTDPAARESLLMQVLYTANSLGRLGADFSLMIAMLDEDEDEDDEVEIETQTQTGTVTEAETTGAERRAAEGGSDGESNGQDGGLRQQQQARDDDDDDDDNNNNYNNYNGEVEDEDRKEETEKEPQLQPQQQQQLPEPEWISVIKKHRVQAARLEALAAGQDRDVQRRESSDIAVR